MSDIEPKDIAELDQLQAAVTRTLPPTLWLIYSGCISEGFTEDQAMQIICSFVDGIKKGV